MAEHAAEGHKEAPKHGAHKEAEVKHEHKPTMFSKEWLTNARKNLVTTLGSAGLVLGSDLFITLGSLTLPSSIATLTSLGNPVPAFFSLLSTGVGSMLGWRGVGKSPHNLEKAGFAAAQTAATLAPTLAPDLVPVARIANLVSTVFGMRHRGGGGHGH